MLDDCKTNVYKITGTGTISSADFVHFSLLKYMVFSKCHDAGRQLLLADLAETNDKIEKNNKFELKPSQGRF